jgi:hypothetical protein
MKVFIVSYNEYTQYEGTDTWIREAFDSEEKAEDFIKEHQDEIYFNFGDKSYFEIIAKEVK